ncbi:MAG: LexA family protein, partial [Vampirovibrionales bacterium]
KGTHAQAGEVVLAQVDGEFTLKTLRYHAITAQPYLEAANSDYAPIYPQQSLSIFGRYIGLVRRSS